MVVKGVGGEGAGTVAQALGAVREVDPALDRAGADAPWSLVGRAAEELEVGIAGTGVFSLMVPPDAELLVLVRGFDSRKQRKLTLVAFRAS